MVCRVPERLRWAGVVEMACVKRCLSENTNGCSSLFVWGVVGCCVVNSWFDCVYGALSTPTTSAEYRGAPTVIGALFH